MQTGIKILTVVVAIALIIVIGLIIMFTLDPKDGQMGANTDASITQDATVNGDEAKNAANEEGSKTPGEANGQAQNEDAQNEPMYEGALAGMTEDEIAKMALAEEQGHTEGESND